MADGETAAEFDLGAAAAAFAGEEFGDEALGGFGFGDAEVVALFDDGAEVAVGSELLFSAVEVAGEPAAFAGGVVEEEFGVAAVEDPDEAGGDFVGAAEGDKGGGEVFLVGGAIAEGAEAPL